MNKKDLSHYFDTHPAINRSALAEEAGITERYLRMILDGDRPLTDSVIEKIKPVMYKYGWRQ